MFNNLYTKYLIMDNVNVNVETPKPPVQEPKPYNIVCNYPDLHMFNAGVIDMNADGYKVTAFQIDEINNDETQIYTVVFELIHPPFLLTSTRLVDPVEDPH